MATEYITYRDFVVLVDMMAKFMSHHEHQFIFIKCFQQTGRKHNKQTPFFRLETGRVELWAGVGIEFQRDINAELFRMNQSSDLVDHMFLSVGIDYGRLLLVGTEDYYGDPVNTASKLGEDLAGKSETLVTERALAETDHIPHENSERMVARISDIEINYLKFAMTEGQAK